jgi:hypothetical protein
MVTEILTVEPDASIAVADLSAIGMVLYQGTASMLA